MDPDMDMKFHQEMMEIVSYDITTATHIALSYSRVQVKPTVEQGPPCQKVKVNKPSTDKTKAKSSDTKHKDK